MKVKRTAEGWARHNEASRKAKQKRRLDPEFRAKENEQAKLRYHKNKEKYRIVALKNLAKNREIYNEHRKQWRRENPELARAANRRSYNNSIKATIAKYRRGDIGIDRLSERLSETFVRLDDRLKTYRDKRLTPDSNDSLRDCETDSSVGTSED